MPTVAQSLGTDLLGISWALLSYQLSNIGLSMVFGRISDLWGREKMFALGFLVFAVSSLLCGFSQTVLQLLPRVSFKASARRCCSRRAGRWRRSRCSEDLAGQCPGIHDHGAPCRLYAWPRHRRGDDRLLELALEFFLSRADRLWWYALAVANLKSGRTAIQRHRGGTVDYLGRGAALRDYELRLVVMLRPAHPSGGWRFARTLVVGTVVVATDGLSGA